MQIIISVVLGSWFKKYYEGKTTLDFTLDSNIMLSDLVKLLDNIPQDEVGIIAVNGVKQCLDYTLSHNDIVQLYPVIISG